MTVTLEDVRAAARVLDGHLVATDTERSLTLSKVTGAQVFLKFENRQFTASFKERGALNRLSGLTGDQKAAGVIAVSAGNHAQGVAYHAQRLDIDRQLARGLGGVGMEQDAAIATERRQCGDLICLRSRRCWRSPFGGRSQQRVINFHQFYKRNQRR